MLHLSADLESIIARKAEASGLTPEAFLVSLIRDRDMASESEPDHIPDSASSPPEPELDKLYGLWRRNGHAVDVQSYLDTLRAEWR